MYNSRITEVHQNVIFLSSRVPFCMTNIFSITGFLREKRLSNAQGRGLCEANAGHAPRGMVCCGCEPGAWLRSQVAGALAQALLVKLVPQNYIAIS